MEYLNGHIHDIKSYEAASAFQTVDSSAENRIIKHSFRCKNGFGAMRLDTYYFRINKSGKVNDHKDESAYDYARLYESLEFPGAVRWVDDSPEKMAIRLQDSINSANNY